MQEHDLLDHENKERRVAHAQSEIKDFPDHDVKEARTHGYKVNIFEKQHIHDIIRKTIPLLSETIALENKQWFCTKNNSSALKTIALHLKQ